MKCLNCSNWATSEVMAQRVVEINGFKYLMYVCNVCGYEVYVSYYPTTTENSKEIKK